ncbi:MAG TPA: DUF5667 domain-containing protein [Patescibacteria group bacterium]|nr:DUF5667 domain-containing protein [Patescibacteria group bacterium]
MAPDKQKIPISLHYIAASLLLLMVGVFMLYLSLSSVNPIGQIVSPDVKNQKPVEKLISGKLVPGNPVYPLYMIWDGIRLYTTRDPFLHIQLLTELANVRLASVQQLYTDNEHALAIATLARAEVYLGRAAQELLDTTKQGVTKQAYVGTLLFVTNEHLAFMMTMKQGLRDEDKTRVDDLIQYTLSLQQTINGLSKTSF